MRVVQPEGSRGSLKWIQRAVNQRSEIFYQLIAARLPGIRSIRWVSPLESDQYAEYRDEDFLERIGCSTLNDELKLFWPARGPQWDALALTDRGEVLLIEAKAHVSELISQGTQAEGKSLSLIEHSLAATITALRAQPKISWTGPFYQFANRLAHLHFLSRQGVAAHLILVCFVGDSDMNGCESDAEWEGALQICNELMGLPQKHSLADRITHVFPRVDQIR